MGARGGEPYLFDISLPGKQFKVERWRFPENNFRYLRVTVFNMPDDPRRVEIMSAESALERKVAAKELVPVEATLTASRIDDKQKASIHEWDLRSRNLPVAVASFDIEDAFFDRAFELYGRNATTETVTVRIEGGAEQREAEAPWVAVGSGVLSQDTGAGQDAGVPEGGLDFRPVPPHPAARDERRQPAAAPEGREVPAPRRVRGVRRAAGGDSTL